MVRVGWYQMKLTSINLTDSIYSVTTSQRENTGCGIQLAVIAHSGGVRQPLTTLVASYYTIIN